MCESIEEDALVFCFGEEYGIEKHNCERASARNRPRGDGHYLLVNGTRLITKNTSPKQREICEVLIGQLLYWRHAKDESPNVFAGRNAAAYHDRISTFVDRNHLPTSTGKLEGKEPDSTAEICDNPWPTAGPGNTGYEAARFV